MEIAFHPFVRGEFPFVRIPFEDHHVRRPCSHYLSVFNEDVACCDPFIRRNNSVVCPRKSFCRMNRSDTRRCSTAKEEENKKEKEETEAKELNSHACDKTNSSTDKSSQKESKEVYPNYQENPYLGMILTSAEGFPSLQRFVSSFRSDKQGPFEVTVNLQDCDPDKIKIEVKEGILKVEGRKESNNGSFTYVRHEQSIPKSVCASSLRATLLSEGKLKIRHIEERTNIPISVESETEIKEETEAVELNNQQTEETEAVEQKNQHTEGTEAVEQKNQQTEGTEVVEQKNHQIEGTEAEEQKNQKTNGTGSVKQKNQQTEGTADEKFEENSLTFVNYNQTKKSEETSLQQSCSAQKDQ